MRALRGSIGRSPARCLPPLRAAMPRPGTISAWSVSLKLLKLIGQGCPRNFTELGGDDLTLGIDEERDRKEAVAGPVHTRHVRVEHQRARRYHARAQGTGKVLPVPDLVGEETENIGF